MNTDPFAVAGPAEGPHCTLVAGGGSGIGRAYTIAARRRGETVCILGRSRERLDEVAAATGAIPHEIDIRDAAACGDAARVLADRHGRVDRLLVCSAIYPKAHFLDQDPGEFAATFETNVVGVANIIRAVLPGMIENYRGRIVVMGTLADMNPIPGSIAYSASKGALHTLVKGIAGEIDPNRYPDVLINEMTPGATRTAMSAAGRAPEDVVPEIDMLFELPSGSPSGAFYRGGRRLYLGESWKGTIRRKLRL